MTGQRAPRGGPSTSDTMMASRIRWGLRRLCAIAAGVRASRRVAAPLTAGCVAAVIGLPKFLPRPATCDDETDDSTDRIRAMLAATLARLAIASASSGASARAITRGGVTFGGFTAAGAGRAGVVGGRTDGEVETGLPVASDADRCTFAADVDPKAAERLPVTIEVGRFTTTVEASAALGGFTFFGAFDLRTDCAGLLKSPGVG